ncbi:DUF3667 domain-containing protein [Lysobacter sp. Root983]|uniref:DUF3667 domain-containing protein n=1 Tax=Lysobacter sp. Root983 TaxID=1736613 RepID=UPI00071098EE|nr:DUF3667 domain-containing protein [Lysobacter sp. Root983]KRD77010.1 hypothetical protein ASE43_07440 [Lysobacter sp. Root983]
MSEAQDHPTPTHCENCAAPLQGHYCHQCGQSIVNPLRHAGHALEEVFESFWHLDGRIFRTVRDLLSPGRVALNYLRGHRVRYVPPLRLFVILSVLTFFIAQFTVHFGEDDGGSYKGNGPMVIDGKKVRLGRTGERIENARSVSEVESERAQALKELEKARAAIPVGLPGGAQVGIAAGIKQVNAIADKRVAELRERARPDAAAEAAGIVAPSREEENAALPATIENADSLAELEALRDERLKPLQAERAGIAAGNATALARNANAIRDINRRAGCRAAQLQIDHAVDTEGALKRKAATDAQTYGDGECNEGLTFFGNAPWDAETNPVVMAGAPEFFNRWLNKQIGRGYANFKRATQDPSLYEHAALSAVPSALFLLVPMFALLLKLTYLGSGRGYLEHLVVALYSHAYLCLSLLAMFLMFGLDAWISPHWSGFGWVAGIVEAGLWLWMPIYLLLMQKRVYGNGWLVTLLRYLVVGGCYFFMLAFAVGFLMIASLVRM